MKSGDTIVATEGLGGTYFEGAEILLLEVNQLGVIGVMLNKPFHKNLNDLVEFSDQPSYPIWEGGPVDQEHLFLVHRKGAELAGALPISGGWYWGGSLKKFLGLAPDSMSFRIFLGYCGWNGGELEQEIAEGCWTIRLHNSSAEYQFWRKDWSH